jgi:hypothetical protein
MYTEDLTALERATATLAPPPAGAAAPAAVAAGGLV